MHFAFQTFGKNRKEVSYFCQSLQTVIWFVLHLQLVFFQKYEKKSLVVIANSIINFENLYFVQKSTADNGKQTQTHGKKSN
jgi:hypothetical protein